jgi:hypothetical protein
MMKNQSKGTNVLPAIPEDQSSELDELITKLIEAMEGHDGHSKEFASMTDNLKTLMEARKIYVERIKVLAEAGKLEIENNKLIAETKKLEGESLKLAAETLKLEEETVRLSAEVRKIDDEIASRRSVSRDTMALIAGNVAGIVMILSFEKANVLTSKALQQIIKIRL